MVIMSGVLCVNLFICSVSSGCFGMSESMFVWYSENVFLGIFMLFSFVVRCGCVMLVSVSWFSWVSFVS